jgi:hypothetical protein
MRSMQCNVEFGYQLSIRSGTKEKHGKPWSSWPVTGPSGCKLTTSQQSGVEYESPNIVSLSVRLLYCRLFIVRIVRNTQIQFIPHRKHIMSTETNRLKLFGETAAVYCESHTEYTDTVRTSQETHHVYRDQPVKAVWGNSRCLLWEPYGTHRYSSYLAGNTSRLQRPTG